MVFLCLYSLEVTHLVPSCLCIIQLCCNFPQFSSCHFSLAMHGVNCIKTLLIPSDICRTVNGLLKTALGPPPGSTTTLSPAHDLTFRLESVKCLVRIIKSMGVWMDQQLRIGEFSLPNTSDNENNVDNHTSLGGDEVSLPDLELHSEATPGISDAATLEQRRAYKLELQVEQ